MIIFLIVAQIFAICVSAYLLLLERKYCQHLDWWYDTAAWLIFIINLLPFLGLITSIVECADCARHIVRELDK